MKNTTLSIFCLLIVEFSVAQVRKNWCGSADLINKELKENANYQALINQNEVIYQRNLKYGSPEAGATYLIPTVVHVLHNNYSSSSYVTQEQVLNAIELANQFFRKQHSSASQISNNFRNIASDMDIELVLAKQDPSGNCVDGITYTNTGLTQIGDFSIKKLVRWDPTKYLNIWIVESIKSGAGGYSYYPGISSVRDGIVILGRQFGSTGISSGSRAAMTTLSHEVGHYLNLAHPWGNSNNPNVQSNCNIDDNVNDTPNTIGSSGSCDLNKTTCGSLDNIENIMDYSSCPSMFTNGQKTRVASALNSFIGSRNNLWINSNLNLTGITGSKSNCAIIPVADFNYTPNDFYTCSGQGKSIYFFQRVYNIDSSKTVNYQWNFQDGQPAQSTDKYPKISFRSPGWKTVTLTASYGNSSNTVSKSIYISKNDGLVKVPYIENFENTNFPNENTDLAKNWSIKNDYIESIDILKTKKVHSPSGKRSYSIFLENSDTRKLRKSVNLISPSFDLSNINNSYKLKFDIASKETNVTASLRVHYRLNCSSSWRVLTAIQKNQYVTGLSVSSGTPILGDWKTIEINLNRVISLKDQGGIQFKIEYIMNSGITNLYLDNISIVRNKSLSFNNITPSNVKIYPNPINNKTIIEIDNNDKISSLSITLLDIVGREIKKDRYIINSSKFTNNSFFKEVKLSKGIYFLKLDSEKGSVTKKIIF